MAIMGYPLVFTIIGGSYIAIALAAIASLGALLFLDYLKEKSGRWWIGLLYPLLLVLIILTEIYSLGTPELFRLVADGMTPTRLRGMLYYLIVPASLPLFAVMTPEFRKIMRIPIVIAALISILMLVPMYETLSYAFSPPDGGMITDVTNGFIILILIGFCGIPPLVVFGLINSLQISKSIRPEMSGENMDEREGKQVTGNTMKTIGVVTVLALVVLIAGIYLFPGLTGEEELPISVPNATIDNTKKYDDVDLGIAPTVKKYRNVVFNIEKIKDTIEKEGEIEVRIDGFTRRIPLEKSKTLLGSANADLVPYTGIGEGRFYEHIFIGNKSFILWIRMDKTEYFIDTTTLEDERGRLVHYIYTSEDVGWSEEHKNLSGYTLSPRYLGDTISETDREIYEFSEEDFTRFPVTGRFLKYGAGNLELTNKEAGDIQKTIGGKTVHYNGHYYNMPFITA